jgi:putative addiction module component (TIGR02574 family)
MLKEYAESRADREILLLSKLMANRREILPRLLKLPVAERARLATRLVESLDEREDPAAAEEWLKELERRMREVTNGTAAVESWTKVRRRIEGRLRSH